LQSLSKKYQQRCNDCLETRKDKTNTTKIKCLVIGKQIYRKEANRNRRYRNTMWNISKRLIITTVIFISLITEQLNKGHEKHTIKTKISHLIYMDN
jgi:hypothetical protein